MAARVLLSLSVVLLLAVACRSTDVGSMTSGIEGQVFIGPMCPVVQVGVDCPDQPYQATIAVLDAGGREVTRFTTDAQGRFRVGLQPGTYTIRPESPAALPYASEQTVTVTEGQFTPVTITYDSGIR